MNKHSIRHWLMTGSIAVFFLSVAALNVEAHGPGRGPHPPAGGTNAVINLTAAQQQALRDAHTNIVAQSQTLLTQLQDARKALQDAVLADIPSEDAIRAAAKTIGDIEGSLAVIRSKELAKIRPLFTADQWAQLRALGLFDHELFIEPHRG